jgi:DNA-directed RNA polymerase subunit H (RpoH/RPB5)
MSLNVYKNLIKALGYRNITLTTPTLADADYIQQFTDMGYVVIKGERKNDIRGDCVCFAVIISPDNNAVSKSQSFRNLVSHIDINLETKTPVNFIIVTQDELSSTINKRVAELYEGNHNLLVETYVYSKFIIDFTKHCMYVPHEIINEETDSDYKHYCSKTKIKKQMLPLIKSTDTPIVWLGAKAGMVIRVNRLSNTAGETIVYRRVIE